MKKPMKKKLNIEEPTIWCKATEHIKEMIELVKILLKKGYAYETSTAIYYDISKFKAKIAEIEENKFSLELELDSKKAILSELNNRASADQNSIQDSIVLHFDNKHQNNVYLPWAHQVRATKASIIYIEETIRTNQKKYNRYKVLIDLNEKLLDEIKNNTSSYESAFSTTSWIISRILVFPVVSCRPLFGISTSFSISGICLYSTGVLLSCDCA